MKLEMANNSVDIPNQLIGFSSFNSGSNLLTTKSNSSAYS